MAPSEKLRLLIRLVLALAHFLPALIWLFRPQKKRYILLFFYCLLSVVWAGGVALAPPGGGRTALLGSRVAGYIAADTMAVLILLLIAIACQILGRRGQWVWSLGGCIWLIAMPALRLLALALIGERLLLLAQVGWAVFSGLLISLSTYWTLRARLAFYRNRGTYWLAVLTLLLAGQGLVWARYQWAAIGLGLHLLGTTATVLCVTVPSLPNLKGVLRTTTGYIVLTVTTALLLLVGLLVGQLLLRVWRNFYAALVGSAGLAILLALVYQPFHRFIAWLVNRLVWRGEHDMDQAVHDYARTISSLLTLDQLATVIMGTVNEFLGVQRGVLVVISKAEHQVVLRAIEGMGRVRDKEIALALNSPVLLDLMKRREPFWAHELEHSPELRDAPEVEKAWLRGLDAEIFVPILARDRLLGLLALGPQRGGEPYGMREIALLNTLSEQTSVALQNAHLFDEVHSLYLKISGLNEDLRRAYTQLKRLDQAKTDFLSISSHELRTPLTVIQGYVGIMEELASGRSLTPDQMLEIIHNFKAAVDRLATVVTAMLDASQIEVQALDLHYTPTTLRAVINMATRSWQEAIEQRHQQLTVEGLDAIPPIEADVQRLCQAFSNLISNAIKYTPDGGKISITASLAEGDGQFEVVIADTGVGIAREDQVLIFEKFYRVGDLLRHSTGDTKFQGAGPGLGLHIARGVIEAHGGRIWVESEGHDEERCPGSAFHVWLPLHPDAAGAQ